MRRAASHRWIGIALITLIAAGCSSSGHTAAPAPPSSAPRPSTSAPAPTSTSVVVTTPTTVAGLSTFVGDWYAHGVGMTIRASGRGTLTWRTYRTCGTDAPPCDTFKPDAEIINGGNATLVLDSANATSAAGRILSTTDASTYPAGRVTARFDPGTDRLTLSSRPDIPMCGPRAAVSACGA